MKQTSREHSADAAHPPAGSGIELQLKVLVLVCGAVLMSLEIIGSRIISPYFGHSIYVWGSLISIFLGALSLGYYIGGRVADKHPSLRLLGSIIAVAGITMLVLRYISPAVCNAVYETHLGPKWGTLITCLILFFIPSVLLGVVSPFSVRLATLTVANVGKTAGMLYALSTVGSIVGTLVTSFVLIDMMGTNTVVLLLGITLIAISLVAVAGPLPRLRQINAPVFLALVALPVAICFSPSQHLGIMATGDQIKYEVDSPYQHIVVSEGPAKDQLKRRNLQFDRYIESAIYVPENEKTADPRFIRAATAYTDMMHLPMVFNPQIKTVLQIGGGGGTVPREYYYHYGFDKAGTPVPGFDVQVAEIDPRVAQVAEMFFYFTPTANLRVTVDDGRMFLRNSHKTYDTILIDAFSGGGQIPFHLTTKEFVTEVKSHLSPNGVAAMNVISALRGGRGELYLSIYRTWRQVGFGQVYVFPKVENYEPPLQWDQPRNVILIATMDTKRLSKFDIADGALGLYQDGILKIDNIVRHAKHYLPEEDNLDFEKDPELKDAIVLTDDFAPVELMAKE